MRKECSILVLLFKISFVIASFLLFSISVIAAQPSLPTFLYGKVLDESTNPVAGVTVTAAWTDSDGREQKTTAKTLTTSQAEELGDMALGGHYVFNQGYVKAKANSMIKVTVDGSDAMQEIQSNPGGGIIRVQTIVIGSGSNPDSGNEGLGGQGRPRAPEFDPNMPSSGRGNQSRTHDGTLSGGASTGLISEFSYSTGSTPPPLPTTVIGQLIGEDGSPVGGEGVVASWTDEKGSQQQLETKTLSKNEAKALGDEDMEGYFMFNEGKINPADGSSINISSPDGKFPDLKVESKPGESVRVNARLFARRPASESLVSSRHGLGTVVNRTSTAFHDGIGIVRDNILVATLLATTAIIILVVAHAKRLSQRIHSAQKRYEDTILFRKIDTTVTDKVKNIMSKSAVSLDQSKDVQEAIRLMDSMDIGSVIVIDDGMPIGLVTEDDIAKYADIRLKDMKVQKIMTPISEVASPEWSILEISRAFIRNGLRKMPVMNKGELVGIVTHTDIARAYDQFYSKNEIHSGSMPSVYTIMNKFILTVPQGKEFIDAIYLMRRSGTDYVVISEGRIPKGIITVKDVVEEYFKNPDRIGSLKVEHVMTAPVTTVVPAFDIFHANRMMLNKGYRRLLVVIDGKLVGIVSQHDVLKSIHDYLSSTVEHRPGVEVRHDEK